MRYVNCVVILCMLFFFIPIAALAGSLDDPGAPTTEGGGAMNTMEDVYNLINAGTTNAPRTGTFAEPSAGPASTGHTLTEIYNRAKTSSRPAKTGQTVSQVDYDDGYYKKGVAWPSLSDTPASARFTDSGKGTVTDNLTGLIWLKNANVPAATRTWVQAFSDVAELNASGTMNAHPAGDTSAPVDTHQTDWRLPNVKELSSLIDWAYNVPALSNAAGTAKWTSEDEDSFTGVQSDNYWSSTTVASSTAGAWCVHLSAGNVGSYDKAFGKYVWPVRGGQ
jgi:hypothetical protein